MMPGMVPPPMMQGMMPGMPGMGVQPPMGQPEPPTRMPTDPIIPEKPKPPPPVDPDVKEFCEHFAIEEECAKRLNEQMVERLDTKESDLAKLYELLEDVGSPTCLLELKIEEMAAGEFVGKVLETREVEALCLNFGLANNVQAKLNEVVARRGTRKGEDLVRMESILEYSPDKNSIALSWAKKMLDGDIEAFPDLREVWEGFYV